ncbi:39S ribosomal protein L17, mitochondrial [Pseudolycoriella hygida]|uniref:Large ribosomal subunit protein bL17m n=1 Tax=Pseudolycoriella hygida TaxID=35572 RepID=A0A9Q0RY28_9DIPT|nr:39S ribosomal protein L17, mitochondrial [Pseudolycoriella hygida]
MNQAEVSKLMSQLRVSIPKKPRRLRNPDGPEGRLNKLRKTVSALVKHERIELNSARAHEARGYAERLISEAIRHGDCHKATMDMANFWMVEKQLVHKLFKVLAPRFVNCPVSYTRMYKAPRQYPGPVTEIRRAVLELRGNPYPPVKPDMTQNRNLIHNVLLDEAKKQYRYEKYAQIAAKLTAGESKAEAKSTESADGNQKEHTATVEEPVDTKEEK